MASLKQIQQPISEDMRDFGPFLKKHTKTKVKLLDLVVYYILRNKGKQIRPTLVFLAAKICGNTNKSSHVAATLIELLHTATLVHDDVVDNASERRGVFSVNAIWKSKISVLVGDFLLSRGMLTALEYNCVDELRVVSDAVKQMSEGELLQMEKSRKLNINEEVYFDIINKKTATLIAACTAVGAHSAGADAEQIDLMKQFGTALGIAFQIRDDLFDYQKKTLAGKPAGNDLQEKKLTLPIIYVLDNSTKAERKRIIKTIKKYHDDKATVSELIELCRQKGGIDYTNEKMHEYKDKALSILDRFEDSPAKEAMRELVEYTIDRTK